MIQEKRKTHCFIDYENVHESGFEGVEALGDGDAVTIFISSVSHKISLVVLETLLRKNCELTIIHTIGTGKNNLDFQLIAEVGYQIGRQANETRAPRFVIISKDRGYENVVTVFAKRGVEISQCETIAKIGQFIKASETGSEETQVIPEWEYSEPIMKSLESLKLKASDMVKIDKIFREANTLAVLHDRLAKAFGKKGNHQIYSKLKTLHKQYQKTLPAALLPNDHDIADRENRNEERLEMILDNEATAYPEIVPAEEVAAEPLAPEKTAVEVKNKTRGRRKKPVETKNEPKASEKSAEESLSDSEPAAEEVKNEGAESQSGAEAESSVPAEVPVEKKKRRPGRPRKKTGAPKTDAAVKDQIDTEEPNRQKTKDN